MKCPHCTIEINPDFNTHFLGSDPKGDWSVHTMGCPNPKCGQLIVELELHEAFGPGTVVVEPELKERITVNPIVSTRSPVPKEVEEKFAVDYKEACLIIGFSPKASAALGRRCLQNILREKAKIKKGNLSDEIQQVIDSRSLPSLLADSIDAIRNVGNFAAHPMKSTSTGEIVDVEPGEAEWILDVLESLFDFYFLQPAKLKAKRDALNLKLRDAGKPPMK